MPRDFFALAGFWVFFAVLPPAYAEEFPADFTCSFESGTSWSYESGKFQSTPPSQLTFDIAKIDLDGQKADLLTGGNETGKLRIVRALNANHFLEVANEGFLNLTTVYDRDAASGLYPAVHSRHFGILGQPVFAQYAGFCKTSAR